MKFSVELARSQAAEARASIENPTIPVSAENFLAFFGVNNGNVPAVTIDSALTVPAVSAAVAFLSRTLAALPLHPYRRDRQGNAVKVGGRLGTVVHDAPNPGMGSFKFRQYFWQQVFTGGRGLAWIERSSSGVEAMWPLDPTKTTIKRTAGRVTYAHESKTYAAEDVIDVPFMLKPDGISHYGPVTLAAKAIQLALAMNDYASNFFAGGGVPPLALTGPLPASPEAMKRAQADIKRSVDGAKNAGEAVFAIPPGYELKAVGLDPEKSQMTDARRFQIEEIARAYQLPPIFLQDLTRATLNNAEQQDLHLVKHLIGQWTEAFEDELNLKVFGRDRGSRYIEHNLDGLMRGDFKSRTEGYARAIQTAQMTPNEVRAKENRPALPHGDDLLIQGATVPLGSQPPEPQEKQQDGAPAPSTDNDDDEANAE